MFLKNEIIYFILFFVARESFHRKFRGNKNINRIVLRILCVEIKKRRRGKMKTAFDIKNILSH